MEKLSIVDQNEIPSLFVTWEETEPDGSWITETEAPGMALPVELTTVPLIADVVSWAKAGIARKTKADNPRNRFLKTIFYSLLHIVLNNSLLTA